MAIAANCSSTFGNLGAVCNSGNGFGVDVGIILTTDSFQFDTFTSFATNADYLTAIKAKQMFPLMDLQEIEDQTEETAYQTTSLGVDNRLRDGKYKFLYKFLLTLKQHQELQKFSAANLRYFRVDERNNILGYSPDGVTVKGFSISTFEAEKMGIASADSVAYSPVKITESSPAQLNSFGLGITPTWEVTSLSSLTNVDIAVVGTATATEIVLNVGANVGLNPDGSPALIEITGLTSADFIVKTTAGATQTVTFTDNNDGTYTGAGTGLSSGTADLVDPTLLSDGLLIESTGSADVSI